MKKKIILFHLLKVFIKSQPLNLCQIFLSIFTHRNKNKFNLERGITDDTREGCSYDDSIHATEKVF